VNVLLISECSKRALVETRRILDQFAERRGERTWQTAITEQGLITLRRLLKKTARKNTAVACHWIRGRDHSELLWIVGDARRFNAQGAVPTNTTSRDVLRRAYENDWYRAEDIRLLAIMAALFHDIGKASRAFQQKLKARVAMADAYRHEWVSLRIFEAFVGAEADEQWLRRLKDAESSSDDSWLNRIMRDDIDARVMSPFAKGRLPPLAQVIGWLIVSHHRLPYPRERTNRAAFDYLPACISAEWNAPRGEATAEEKAACWTFDHGLPFASADWRRRASDCAEAILARPELISRAVEFLNDPYVMHLSRLVLMLADHYYSSQDSSPRYGDSGFPLYANTDRKTGECKQRLDEHLIGVASNARRLGKTLPRLDRDLPRIARHQGFKRRATHDAFRWQDKAFDLAVNIQRRSAEHGFFGVDMASTGCGKTLANGRIMYGLSDPVRGARFSIALGLRTLTLQTGNAYRERLGLGEDDLAVLVGGGAVRHLFESGKRDASLEYSGSESAADLMLENTFVHYESSLDIGPLQRWLSTNPSANKLVNAPVLVCTVDHLVPATESVRGGHQIAPLLRLLTSDLVLDEVDDFDLSDLPALSRLVHWAGVFGSKVLLSSATLPPALVQGLFDAYREGRAIFQRHRGERRTLDICCAWFDEFSSESSVHESGASFEVAHREFVKKRIDSLRKSVPRRRAKIVPVRLSAAKREELYAPVARWLSHQILELHERHHLVDDATKKRTSIGLVRFANIDPLIEVGREMAFHGAPASTRLHLCLYHARHPLLMRSRIEQRLDLLLKRHLRSGSLRDPFLDQWEVRLALEGEAEHDQIFVVLASPVAEVGRDHDYDWAIVEPSSIRSIIQLAGRVRRHRPGAVSESNIYLMDKNFKGLSKSEVAFVRPGFESERYRLESHSLNEILEPSQLEPLDSAPRIAERESLQPSKNLADLEHRRLRALMLSEGEPLSIDLWWRTPVHLCAGLQMQQKFRAGPATRTVALLPDDEADEGITLREFSGGEWGPPLGNLLENVSLNPSRGISFWGATDYLAALHDLAERLELDPIMCAKKFGFAELRGSTQGWSYHPCLGFAARE
jgi:CRISPR-associated endonuclease/helicase Cas3